MWFNPIRDYAFPVIGDLPLDLIEIEHVVAVMRAAREAGAPETARRVRARIERVLDAAIKPRLHHAASFALSSS